MSLDIIKEDYVSGSEEFINFDKVRLGWMIITILKTMESRLFGML